jgi:hypothetical protein
MLDTAQKYADSAVILTNAKYATAAAINAAVARIDTSLYVKERALLIIANETTTAATTLTVQDSLESASSLANVLAAALTNPETGAAATLSALTTVNQVIAVDLNRVRRYLTVTAATNPTTSNGAAIAVYLVAQKVRPD